MVTEIALRACENGYLVTVWLIDEDFDERFLEYVVDDLNAAIALVQKNLGAKPIDAKAVSK